MVMGPFQCLGCGPALSGLGLALATMPGASATLMAAATSQGQTPTRQPASTFVPVVPVVAGQVDPRAGIRTTEQAYGLVTGTTARTENTTTLQPAVPGTATATPAALPVVNISPAQIPFTPAAATTSKTVPSLSTTVVVPSRASTSAQPAATSASPVVDRRLDTSGLATVQAQAPRAWGSGTRADFARPEPVSYTPPTTPTHTGPAASCNGAPCEVLPVVPASGGGKKLVLLGLAALAAFLVLR